LSYTLSTIIGCRFIRDIKNCNTPTGRVLYFDAASNSSSSFFFIRRCKVSPVYSNNGIDISIHCCPVKMSEKQNSLYFDLLNGIKKTLQIHIPEENTSYDTGL
jgi:hypothetical protein